MKQIPMLDLQAEYTYLKKEIDAALGKCLEHQRWILGPEVKEFEERVAGYLGMEHCIGCSSGTEALVLSLRALAIKTKGKEYFDRTDLIITTPFTFTATGDAILRAGAIPVFVDIDPATFNIDPIKIREYISFHISRPVPDGSKVVGILPVHLYGQSCEMDEIAKIAHEYDLFIVEDVAQAFGGMWKGAKLGSLGNTGAFSFFPSKNLGGFGDGGMVSTNDGEVAELVSMLLKHGGKDKYNVDHIGYNARLDTLQAAVLLAKLNSIDEFNERRRKTAEMYDGAFKKIAWLTFPGVLSGAFHVYNQYTIMTANRNSLQQHLKESGISSMVYYPFPLHKMKVFGDGRSKVAGDLSNTEQACKTVLSLPIEPLQIRDDTTRVIDAIANNK